MTSRTRLMTVASLLSAIAIVCSGGCFKKDPVELAWTFMAGAPIHSTPAVGKDMLVFGNEDGTVIAIDKTNNTFRWRFMAGMNVISAPKLFKEGANQKILFGSINYSFYAIDNQGREVWRFPTRKPIKSDPVIAGDNVYFTSYDGHVYALRIEDRATQWGFP